MPQIDVDDQAYQAVRLAANAAGVSVSEVLLRALDALAAKDPVPAPDPWAQVPVYAEYLGRRVEGLFLPATGRLVVTTGALAGREFASPSAAAGAVVAEANPGRDARTNGWRLWHVAATREHLDVLRPPKAPRGRR